MKLRAEGAVVITCHPGSSGTFHFPHEQPELKISTGLHKIHAKSHEWLAIKPRSNYFLECAARAEIKISFRFPRGTSKETRDREE